ncbi:ATP-binding protein [Marinobacter qingdaonensis]|uniref:ATP-binding protein n=1 Tax=Marinobacter qingdaonensis TaxID=3108486 RepID=A0ABU5NUW8_9GAMM|nr:ATP-binding protein [Marinobacter sp. ASW11-75]MEA1079581.1 ATP-binding protein [Marinobacter sp. ASW11-75]
MASVIVRFQAKEANIEKAIEQLELYLETLDVSPEHQFQIQTCCREALNNIVEHGTQGQQESPLMFSLSLWLEKHPNRRRARVQITDNGAAYEPPTASPKPDELSLSGRGWSILQQWSDELSLTRKQGLNYLTITKRLD